LKLIVNNNDHGDKLKHKLKAKT